MVFVSKVLKGRRGYAPAHAFVIMYIHICTYLDLHEYVHIYTYLYIYRNDAPAHLFETYCKFRNRCERVKHTNEQIKWCAIDAQY